MIRYLSGRLLFKDLRAACVAAGGVGYQVQMPLGDLAGLGEDGDEVSVHVHTHVREGAIELFGFRTADGLSLFEQLIGVSGVGPKSAIGILSGLEPSELLDAVLAGDEARLTRAPGVGKKTAARIVLELRDRLKKQGLVVGASPGGAKKAGGILQDLESALANLGYRPAQIDKAVAEVKDKLDDGATLEELVRAALQHV